MKELEIKIRNKTYEYVKCIAHEGKGYIAYSDQEKIYISEYKILENQEIKLLPINNKIFRKIKRVMEL